MFEDIYNYILKSKEYRQKHLSLDEECIEIGGNSPRFRGLLAHYLKTTIPSGSKIMLCHACNNGKCSNPKHLYWGTPKENYDDGIINGTMLPIQEYINRKYTKKEFSEMLSNVELTEEQIENHRIACVNDARHRVKKGTHNWQNPDTHICPWCGKTGKGSVMYRHHFDNCKSRN